MKKKILLLFSALLVSFALSINVSAEDEMPDPKSIGIIVDSNEDEMPDPR